ncbi:protein-L-isoaspartate O-methyltransferase [candidate division BRC1 bacterium HGW-BRC1-1]|nr:MAG: protein-L-isoaspartate O-methyltransferase [candidate division BRC1 bacterium HGW-BRC1-1]
MVERELTNDSMIEEQVRARGVTDAAVLGAMRRVDRAVFVPEELRDEAYDDCALPVSLGQTISQPYIVGFMTQLLGPCARGRVLDVGTGTGYQTAVLAQLAETVFTLELLPELAQTARARLENLGYDNIRYAVGDGWHGWPQEAPFDGILTAAAAECVPETLCNQLAIGGRLVVPVGVEDQELIVIERVGPSEFHERKEGGVRFVPLVHGASGDS